MGWTVALFVVGAVFGQVEPLEEQTVEALEPPLIEPSEPADAIEPLEELEGGALEPLDQQPTGTMSSVTLRYPAGTVLYVNASSLALRTGPRRDAVLVHYMPQDTRVVALDDVIDSVPEKLGSLDGHWVYLQQGQHKGYTFDAYLVKAPPGMEEQIDWVCKPGKRVGPIMATTGFEELSAVFGPSNVGDAEIPVGNGKTERGTVVFAGDDERRLFIQWEYYKVKPKAVIVEGTRWRTTKGIGIGSRLSEIVRANNGPISFAGFGWDYSGYVMSWRGGTLEDDHVLRDDMALFVAPTQPYLPADYDALVGDREFSSELEESGKLNLRVNAMTIMVNE